MIIVRLLGGLGNQMFQYACGRSVAIRTSQRLKLDISSYPDHLDRTYELSHFGIEADIATPEECSCLRWAHPRSWRRLVNKALAKLHLTKIFTRCDAESYMSESAPFCVDSRVLATQGSAYLQGYWQNERYFHEFSEEIRQDLAPRNALSAGAAACLDEIGACEAVSVHVRRGDYVVGNPCHGVLPLEYYTAAVGMLADKIREPRFFIFSDDPDWVRGHLQPLLPYSVVPGHHSGHEDLWLMSRCRHHIIANSSFSWWGAWLNPDSSKLVFAPRKWFSAGPPTYGLVPSTWTNV